LHVFLLYSAKNLFYGGIMNTLRHLAVIMDGNGRWAEQRGLPRWRGHERGLRAVRRLAEAACHRGIPIVSLFAFSSENWKRPAEEVGFLFNLFLRYLAREQACLIRDDIRISAFGRRDRIPERVRLALESAEAATKNCRRLHMRIALDYGAHYEIVEAARSLARDVLQRTLMPEDITEDFFAHRLDSGGIPDPDLIIRTAGEQRLSNFLLWQASYSELYFCSKMWPDFEEDDLDAVLDDFRSRTRKFGALAGKGLSFQPKGKPLDLPVHGIGD
jgi:undecaprenyl diphosphate synthase